ncbi:hypothetical protein GTW25_14050 [Aliihoeflea aestuarii]|jgi:putative SOS response-associated peptidase YedK|uniref:hypothetical protein n=1 Tax=Aliihoeflea aestuarii TaxID=453840 RepID=UPI0020947312|nr:hypothetical protein [Aliihoeflea aestuarii]MCO6392152.1 hypothetical protein [Aliihoeflea aestuarii]
MAETKPHEWMDPKNPDEAEIRHLVEHTDLSPNQAAELVRKHGADRENLMKIAATIKAES